jgi:hypothetical protein
MKPSSTPAAAIAVFRFAMSAAIMAWPTYLIGAVQTGRRVGRRAALPNSAPVDSGSW